MQIIHLCLEPPIQTWGNKKVNKNDVAALKILGSSTGNMLVDNIEVLKEIFLTTDLIIVVHSEDEEIINANLVAYKSKFGSNFWVSFKIRSEEACLKSTKVIINLAKETNARLHVICYQKWISTFSNNILKR